MGHGHQLTLRYLWERRAPRAYAGRPSITSLSLIQDLVHDAKYRSAFRNTLRVDKVSMKNRSSKATKIRYLLTEEYSTSEIAEMVGSSSRWVRACRARVRRPPSRYAVL